MKKIYKILIPTFIVCVVLGLFLASYFSRRIPKNPASATGNTAGNLLNGGLFCENNGTIFFSNPYDSGKLYSMSSDCSDIKYLKDDAVSYINSYGKYVYYVKKNAGADTAAMIFRGELYGVVRCKQNGTHTTTLVTGYCNDLSLSGNTLVYNTNKNSQSVTNKISITQKGNETIYAGDINNAGINDGKIYYSNNGTNHCVYSMDISDGATAMYCDGNTLNAMVVDNKLYYIDIDNGYALTCVDISNSFRSVLTDDKVINYNIYDGVVYYQKEGNTFTGDTKHALMRMNLDGSGLSQIIEGDTSSISCTSVYTFFQLFGADDLYRVETRDGSVVQKFYIQNAD